MTRAGLVEELKRIEAHLREHDYGKAAMELDVLINASIRDAQAVRTVVKQIESEHDACDCTVGRDLQRVREMAGEGNG